MFCRYKMGKRYIELSHNDYADILRGRWLNDKHMDVLLYWVMQNTLKTSKSADVHVFGTQLYTAIADWCKAATEGSTFRLELATKRVNIFEKKHIIMPICEGHHWMLAVVSWPKIIITDSLKPRNIQPLFQNLKNFLQYEATKRVCASPSLELRYVDCTQQKNLTDCGIYTLRFGEKIAQQINAGQILGSAMLGVKESRISRSSIARAMDRWGGKFSDQKKKEIPTEHEKTLHSALAEAKTGWRVGQYYRRIIRLEGEDYVLAIGRGGKNTIKRL